MYAVYCAPVGRFRYKQCVRTVGLDRLIPGRWKEAAGECHVFITCGVLVWKHALTLLAHFRHLCLTSTHTCTRTHACTHTGSRWNSDTGCAPAAAEDDFDVNVVDFWAPLTCTNQSPNLYYWFISWHNSYSAFFFFFCASYSKSTPARPLSGSLVKVKIV